jgi:peptidoglycan/LPS O-acetylase OafA/YrhL
LASNVAFVFGAAAYVAILYMADHGQPLCGFLPLQHLGVISYSIYMVHALVEMTSFKLMERVFGIQDGAFPLVFLPLILIAIIGFGHLCWKFVEQPAHRLFLRMAPK